MVIGATQAPVQPGSTCRNGGGTEGGADEMTTDHGWQNGGGGQPDDQRPLPLYPWDPAYDQSTSQRNGRHNSPSNGQSTGTGMSSVAANHAHTPYQPSHLIRDDAAPRPPLGNSPADGDRPDTSYPLRTPGPAVGQSGGDFSADGRIPAGQMPSEPGRSISDDDEDGLEHSITARMARLS